MRSKTVVSALVWLHGSAPYNQGLDYWRTAYAQKAARNNNVLEYRQHHFNLNSVEYWPQLTGVNTLIDPRSNLGGLEEYAVKRMQKFLDTHDLKSGFQKLDYFVANRTNHQSLLLPPGNKNPAHRKVILIQRKSNCSERTFNAFIKKTLAPAFAASPGLLEVRYQLFNIPHCKAKKAQSFAYDAMLILGAADRSAFTQALRTSIVTATHTAQQQCCEVIHAYTVAATYVFTLNGRPTLPQTRPERKLPLEPVRRKLPPAPPRASRKSSRLPFPRAQRIPLSGRGPEDVVVDEQGRLLCGVADGRILRIDLERRSEETIGHTGGRPLGLEVLPDGQLLICDVHKGLLQMNIVTGVIETLVQFVDGIPLRFCSNAAAASDGSIWFTESTNRYDFEQYTGAMLEHRPSGRLFRRDRDGQVEVVFEDLHFANGITLSNREQAIIFAETDGYRLQRLWIRGPLAGKREILANNLPGFPDNLSRINDGKFWMAMVTSRNPLLDRLGRSPGILRKLLWRIPDRWQPKGAKTAWVMLLDEQGNCLLDLQSSSIRYYGVTGVAEREGYLYLASTEEDALLAVALEQSR